MIGLIGRRPASQLAQATLAADSLDALNALIAKAAVSPGTIFDEADFPNHWRAHKHHFLYAQHLGKCAFCETRTSAGYPGDVEHFRPKSYCQQLSPASNLNDIGGHAPGRVKGPKSYGYWWLAYDWSNYLFSCNRCNSIWKKNQFPIDGQKAQPSAQVTLEQHLLINPFEENPENHFDYDANTGQIRGVTRRGQVTVEVCGLNRRSLDVDRSIKGKKLIKLRDRYFRSVGSKNVQAQNDALNALLDECRCKESYAALARIFVKREIQIDYASLLQMKRRRLI